MNDLTPNGSWCQSLYEAKAAGLLVYGRALGLSHSESEDVVQETFVALLRLPYCPDEPEHYCLRTFRNRAMNFHRTVWRRLARELESTRWFERSADHSQAEIEAMQHLSELPAEQREVIVLKIWNDMTFEEIGKFFDLSPNTVSGQYRYGLGKLKAAFKDRIYERDEPLREAVAILDAASPVS